MAETVIRVKNLSKRYRIGEKEERKDTFAGQIGHIITAPVRNFRNLKSLVTFKENESNVHWALRDINFEVDRGEVLGIIGHNGAGKSTLLKILSSITPPTSGEIEMTGRVSSLLEIGTGFHPELSGRENVYMNGTILGMSKNEIDHKMDEIIDFSGVEKYIDTPVKFYSSGMKVRLGFSVAAHLEPEILIIDEVLAVGDAEFQKKCIGKMERVAGEGRTVLFVSHQMGAVTSLTSRCILLNEGRIKSMGNTNDMVSQYLSLNEVKGTYINSEENENPCRITKVYCNTSHKSYVQAFGGSMEIVFEVHCKTPLKDAALSFQIINSHGVPVIHCLLLNNEQSFCNEPKSYRLVATLPSVKLYPDHYTLDVHFADNGIKEKIETLRGICRFDIELFQPKRDYYWNRGSAIYFEDHNWKVL